MSNTIMPYGFISTDGTFYSVEWGEHTEFAFKYIDDNALGHDFYEWWKRMDMKPSSCDYLVYQLGWLLIHSPHVGLPFVTCSSKPMTKAQKETLFDYYTIFGRNQEAAALFEE